MGRPLLLFVALVGSLVLSCSARTVLQAPNGAPPAPLEEKFVEIRDGGFVMGCNKFKIAGWNQWEVVEAAAGAPYLSGASIPVGATGPQLVRALLQRGAALGLNTMRTWVHAVNPQYALQTAPGVYNEATFQGLDYVLDEARKAGVKLILAFTTNWSGTGGIPEYVKWAGLTDNTAFFTNPLVKNTYKEFVTTIINRRNTINGRLYRDDPVVLAWNLLNEPRCEGCQEGTIAAWYTEMAEFVKRLDPNHLVTTGEEGFYGPGGDVNPGVQWSEWAAGTGQNFIEDHSSPAIDFATIHSWPDNWQEVSEEFVRKWISRHTEDAATILKKPLVLEEWGKWVNVTANASLQDRTAFMTAALDEVEKLVAADTALQGSAFWQWYLEGQEAAPTEGGGRGLFGIYETDDAFALISANAAFIQRVNAEPLPGCTAALHKAVTVGPASDCSQTWVNGIPGTGMEGEACGIPINECVRGTSGCDPNAACVDTPAGFECRCYWGFAGDGTTCTPTPALTELKNAYFSQPMGQSCDEGGPVAWPNYSPGFVYDPMNSLAFYSSGDGKVGSPTNVTLEQCMIACQMDVACESFVYNDVQMKCFLANGQCPVYNYCVGEETICSSTNDRGGEFQFGCGYWISYYRLDMDVATACTTFQPDPLSVGLAQPEVMQQFEAFKAANPTRFGGNAAIDGPAAAGR